MGGSRAFSIALAIATAAACSGCPEKRIERGYPLPKVSVLLAKVGARQRAISALRGKAVVDHMDGKQRVKGDVNVLLERPAKLHFRATDPAGGVAAKLATDGSRFMLLDVAANRFLQGAATPCNLARLAQIAMAPFHIIDILTGSAPIPVGAKSSLAWDPKAGAEVITLALANGGKQELRLDGRGKQPTWDVLSSEEKDAKGTVVWRVSHHDWRVVEGVRLPAVTKFNQPARKSDVIVKWDSQTPNPDPAIPAEAWFLDPDGMTPEEVTCE